MGELLGLSFSLQQRRACLHLFCGAGRTNMLPVRGVKARSQVPKGRQGKSWETQMRKGDGERNRTMPLASGKCRRPGPRPAADACNTVSRPSFCALPPNRSASKPVREGGGGQVNGRRERGSGKGGTGAAVACKRSLSSRCATAQYTHTHRHAHRQGAR